MPSLCITARTIISAEQFVAALTNFGPERGTIWGNSQPTHFVLHGICANEAEVTEGSKVFGGVWERVHYDWSIPGIVKIRTIDSNIWANDSGWHYKLEQADDGNGILITARVSRYPRTKKGYLLLIFLGSVGRPIIKKSFKKTIRAIEKQNQIKP